MKWLQKTPESRRRGWRVFRDYTHHSAVKLAVVLYLFFGWAPALDGRRVPWLGIKAFLLVMGAGWLIPVLFIALTHRIGMRYRFLYLILSLACAWIALADLDFRKTPVYIIGALVTLTLALRAAFPRNDEVAGEKWLADARSRAAERRGKGR